MRTSAFILTTSHTLPFSTPRQQSSPRPPKRHSSISRPHLQPPHCALNLPPIRNVIPGSTYLLYMSHLFLSEPTGPLTPLLSLREAMQLSFNFCYVTPVVLPFLAPTLHPMLEAIFNFVVAWALLLLAFVSEDVTSPNVKPFKPSATIFLAGTAFLTNILYLPYITLHTPNKTPLTSIPPTEKSPLLTLTESRKLPALSLSMALSSIPWAIFARPTFGPFTERLTTFLNLLSTDILAHSFLVDLIVFSLFQAWLVHSDASRRQWRHDRRKDAVVLAATFVPFFGLAWYVWTRACDAPIVWGGSVDKRL